MHCFNFKTTNNKNENLETNVNLNDKNLRGTDLQNTLKVCQWRFWYQVPTYQPTWVIQSYYKVYIHT